MRNGHEVVVKVQRPGVRETVRDDMEVLTRLATIADSRTDAGRQFGFGQLLAQFRRSLAGELDYRREAKNLVTFGELTAEYDRLIVPQPVMEGTTSRLLTMDRMTGRKVTDIGRLGLMDIDARPIVEQVPGLPPDDPRRSGFFTPTPTPATCCSPTTGVWPCWTWG